MHMRTHWLRDTGAAMSPFAAFLTLLRVSRRCTCACRDTARTRWRSPASSRQHDAVEWVNYPGLPSHPHHAAAKQYLPDGRGRDPRLRHQGRRERRAGSSSRASKLASHLANIGDAKTLVIHPASTTHSQLTPEEQVATGVSPEYVRVSVGIEDVDDIIADLDQALRASR